MPHYLLVLEGSDAPRNYNLLFHILGTYRGGKPKKKLAKPVFKALSAVGIDRGGMVDGDFVLKTIPVGAKVQLHLTEGERSLLLEIVEDIDLPTFALETQDAIQALLENAERISDSPDSPDK